MLTVADMGEGGVKNHQKSADVLYGWSPTTTFIYILYLINIIFVIQVQNQCHAMDFILEFGVK